MLITIVIFLAAHGIEMQFGSFIQKIEDTNKIDSHAYITVTSEDEFAELAKVYNNMLTRIHHLIQTVYEQKLLTQNAELKTLHSQINPHFLYNTLDGISSLIDMKRPDDAKKALTALAKIMRMSIKGPDLLSIGEDLDYVKEYIFIQKMRFQRKVLFLIDVPSELYDYSIPKLCIQPLIENSLIHGVGNLLEQGMIAVLGEEYDDCITISVCDNGMCISKEVREGILNPGSSEFKGMGLVNIHRRIQMLYGCSYGLNIKSSPEKGNQVIIKLPKMKKEID